MAELKPQVRLLGFASLLNDSASEMIYPLLPVFLTSVLGATPVTVGVIEGAADGLASILKYFAGSISDKLPRRKPLVVIGYGLAAASRALIAVAGRWLAVLTARLIDRTGKGIRSAPRDAIIADVTPAEDRGRASRDQVTLLDAGGRAVGSHRSPTATDRRLDLVRGDLRGVSVRAFAAVLHRTVRAVRDSVHVVGRSGTGVDQRFGSCRGSRE